MPYLGESLSLLTAIVWSLAVILFKKSGEYVHPIALNSFKNSLAFILLIPTIYLFGEKLFLDAPMRSYWIIVISGALGIGLGDTLFFKSLNILGAGLNAIVDCLYSPFVILASMAFLGERLTVWQGIGAVIIIVAVFSITFERTKTPLERKTIIYGMVLGIISIACMALGIVMVKPVLNDAPLLWVTIWRLFGGIVFLLILIAFTRERKPILQTLINPHGFKYTLWGSILGAYFAMAIWLAGMKYTQASISSVLNQTSNMFIFIFAALILKERINWQRTLAIVIGLIGIVIVTLG